MIPILANAGVPMLAIQLPALIGILIPIILIEARAIRRCSAVSSRRSVSLSVAANLLSTFVGVPITWVVLVAVQMLVFWIGSHFHVDEWMLIPFSIPWVIPVEGPLFWWSLGGAALLLLVPYYFVSVYSECWLIGRMEPAIPKSHLLHEQKRSHLITYSLMFVASLISGWIMIA